MKKCIKWLNRRIAPYCIAEWNGWYRVVKLDIDNGRKRVVAER